jgi:hypothetical protein
MNLLHLVASEGSEHARSDYAACSMGRTTYVYKTSVSWYIYSSPVLLDLLCCIVVYACLFQLLVLYICPLKPEVSPSPPVIAQAVKNVHQGLDLVLCSIFMNTLLTFSNKQTLRVLHVDIMGSA